MAWAARGQATVAPRGGNGAGLGWVGMPPPPPSCGYPGPVPAKKVSPQLCGLVEERKGLWLRGTRVLSFHMSILNGFVRSTLLQ
uniref:Uncharacterized protein n=1 Tax=Oryza sativa subsp. japonica TaxID=39947 RepID=Q10P04_ORYSJ|nr:hypothetical protein LOC_Os03g14780 [Oryza sativa Japonica Group]